MRADYLERVRTHAFLVTVGFAVYFTYVCLPPNPSPYTTLEMGGARGIYNSAYVGCLAAMLTSIFLSLVGFYVTKNAIERDRRTGVGPILAASALPSWLYLLGKWASNWAVLATIAGIVAVGAIGMQWVRGEDTRIDVLQIVTPFVIVTLPAMALTAAFAVFFESVRQLRSGFGNALYFFLWPLLVSGPSIASKMAEGGIGDALGVSTIMPSILRAVQAAFPDLQLSSTSFSLGLNFNAEGSWELRTFPWSGMDWSAARVLPRLFWCVAGLAVALVAAVPFDRFDPSRGRLLPRPKPTAADVSGSEEREEAAGRPDASVGDLVPPARSRGMTALILAELRLALGAMPRAWWLVALAVAVACWVAPLFVTRDWLLPLAWIWPLLVWSEMGARETRHQTAALVFSSAGSLARQLPAAWIAGALIAIVIGSGALARLVMAGDGSAALAWSVGALFIPSLALAAGVWTGSGKLFEILYLVLWYLGPLQRFAPLDFAGSHGVTAATAWFAAAVPALMALAFVGRRRAMAT
jgi:hypothetical protein